MSRTQVFEWHKRFMEGWEDVEDDKRPGHPSASNTEETVDLRVKRLIKSTA
jgi:hypothetical protein